MFEMVALFVGYFLYESDANNWWFTAYWIIVGLHMLEQIGKANKELKARKANKNEGN